MPSPETRIYDVVTLTETTRTWQREAVDAVSLFERVQKLEDRVGRLEAAVEVFELIELPGELRKPSLVRAKEEIADYLSKRTFAWTGDIAEALDLDLEVTVRALEKLEKEGAIRARK